MSNLQAVLTGAIGLLIVTQAALGVSVISEDPSVFPVQTTENVGPGGVNSQFLPGDANEDGWVTDADYTIWADHYGSPGATWQMGDFNGDGEVTDADYTIWADNYGSGYNTQPQAPEPLTAIAVLTSGGLVAGYLRRRLA